MRSLYSILFFLLFGALTFGQTTQTEFGKNRVQFHHDFADWSQYESRNFITYWYGEGRLIGQSVVQMAEFDFAGIQNIVDYKMNDKIEIIVYTDLTDLKQSNIGSEEAFLNTGGQTKIVGNKMFVYFNGDHNDLRRQIREGVASIFMNAMLFGSNLQEIVQNAVMMELPAWFKEGLVAYVGQTWSTDLDNELRDLLLSGKYENFESLAEAYPKLAGHSLWYFIALRYGHPNVSHQIYITRMNRDIESGFLYALGSTYRSTTDAWAEFFRSRYESEAGHLLTPKTGGIPLQEVAVKNKKNRPISQLKISPDGTKIAYATNEIGRVRVYVQDLTTGGRKLVFKGGFRNAIQATDYNYPLLAWSPSNMELAVLFERRDVPKLMKYQVLTHEKTTEDLSTEFQRVYSMDYINVNDLVFSAAVRGQSDLFRYFTITRQTQRLTSDFWDDLDAAFVSVHGQQGLLFASNRADSLNVPAVLDSVLPTRDFDIYYLNLDHPTELVQVTHTPHANERQPIAIDSTWFGFLSDESGIYNQKTGYLEDYIHHFENVIVFENGEEMRLHADSIIEEKLDSAALSKVDTIWQDTIIKQRAVHHFITNYDRNILAHHKARRNSRFVEMNSRDEKLHIYQGEMVPQPSVAPFLTACQLQNIRAMQANAKPFAAPEPVPGNVLKEAGNQPIDVSEIPPEKQDTGKIDIDNYLFQSEFDNEEVPVRTVPKTTSEPSPIVQQQVDVISGREKPYDGEKVHDFRPGRIIPYRLKFRTDYMTTQLDNSLLFDGLSSYAGVPQDFGYPPPGILLKANFKDLFEDYEFEGGVRVPTSFNGAEYFLLFNDRKKRLDKRYAVYHRRLRFTQDPTPPPLKYENSIALGQYQLRYPLDVFTSIRATATLRFDKTTLLATDRSTLEFPTQRTQRLGIRGEYVFDNTLDVSLNVKNGTRYKVFAEVVKGFEADLANKVSIKANDGFMTILGLDFRHYQRVLRYSVLAARLAGATSFGQEKVLYMLGGTDNWLLPQFDMTIPLPSSDDFVYRAIATNVRGFQLNARNGNTYALFNAEFRSPVFRYLFRHSQSNFARNFQVVAFFDAGTAWQGINPFNEDSPLNTWTDSNNNVTITVNYFRDPIVYGYGAGIRTLLLGYFIRLDYARGVETRQVQDPKLYFSIGMDF
ncbi:MAG: hypothetical protein EPO28_04730 [Saprospiraceae bacterium]|nr:MAG: hypothetical protein EPO28_04730 [Saprospiraceae bacterium]